MRRAAPEDCARVGEITVTAYLEDGLMTPERDWDAAGIRLLGFGWDAT